MNLLGTISHYQLNASLAAFGNTGFASLACHWGYSIIVARLDQVSTARMLRRSADWQLD
jgi:hypothetical protein